MPTLVVTSPENNQIADSGTMRELAELSRAFQVLKSAFAERFKVDIPDCTIRLLTEAELDEDFERTRNPMRRYELVAFAEGTEIAFNPHSSFIDRIKFLAHELGHCTLYANGFEPDEYQKDGVMGSKRVYHEEVGDFFGRQGEEILREHGFLGGRLATFFAIFNIADKLDRLGEGAVIAGLLKNEALTMHDILTRPDDILAAHPNEFKPRHY